MNLMVRHIHVPDEVPRASTRMDAQPVSGGHMDVRADQS